MAAKDDLPPLLEGWSGFHDPNFTPIPDEFFDLLLGVLTDVEIRVLLYIMRRTYGFKKQSDNISISQMVNGITKRDGERLDSGAGISKHGVVVAVHRLEARGVLDVQHNTSPERGHEATTYRVRKAGDPLVPRGNKGTDPLVPPGYQGTLVPVGDKPLYLVETSLVPGLDRNTAITRRCVPAAGPG